ncbi:hypothetical protein FO519_007540 [Halicephalobus sp. NKZ332]|nr:hypothetical protein FO519_007540 [Halicephalobus sp. NKZ332]
MNSINMEKNLQVSSIIGQGKVNQLGGLYINGRPLDYRTRQAIVEMYRNGEKPCNISRRLKVSHGAVSKILNRFQETGSIQPGQIGGSARTRKTVVQFEKEIRAMKEANPEIHAKEIRLNLIKIGKCTKENAPTESSIARRLTAYKRAKIMGKQKGKKTLAENSVCEILSSNNPNTKLNHSIENILSSPQGSGSNPNSSSVSSTTGSTNDDTWTDEEDTGDSSRCSNNENRRNRTAFTSEQVKILEQKFNQEMYPDEQEKQQIIEATGLDLNRVNTWFSNRRARFRKSCGYSVSSEVLPPIPSTVLNPQPPTLPFFNFPPQAPRYPNSQISRYPDPHTSRYPNPQFSFFQPPLFSLNALMLLQKLQQKQP